MRELKILAVVIFFTLVTYYLVEPYAHSQMHKHVEGHDFIYDGKLDVEEAKARIEKIKKDKEEAEKVVASSKDAKAKAAAEATIAQCSTDLKKAEATLATKKAFWDDVAKIANLKGDATHGEEVYAMCQGCHMEGAMNMGGVTPPSLEHAGALYDKNYLIALVKNPAMGSNVDHKYADTSMHPMGSIMSMVTTDQDIADVVAYLKSKKAGEVTPKEAFVDACGRCHALRYEKWTQVGFRPAPKEDIKTGTDIAMLDFNKKVAQEQIALANYLGKLPPDLSIIVRARSEHFLETFVEDPQSQLPGTAMPRVGLTKESYDKVIEYLEDSGDTKRHERSQVGTYVMIFMLFFALAAILWKKEVWKELH